MRAMRFAFLGAMLMALMWVGCCSAPDPRVEKKDAEENAKLAKKNTDEPFDLNGRIVDFKKECPDRKDLGGRWGFRAAEKKEFEYILKAYPEEFDQGLNAAFMHRRRAKFKLKLVETRPDGLRVVDVLDVLEISERPDGN